MYKDQEGKTIQFQFTKIIIQERKTDQMAEGQIYELHDDINLEPDVRSRQKLLDWIALRDRSG